MNGGSSVGFTFAGYWAPSIDDIALDKEEVLEVLQTMSLLQYFLLTQSCAAGSLGFSRLVTEYLIVTDPERAADLIRKTVERRGTARALNVAIDGLKKSIEHERASAQTPVRNYSGR